MIDKIFLTDFFIHPKPDRCHQINSLDLSIGGISFSGAAVITISNGVISAFKTCFFAF